VRQLLRTEVGLLLTLVLALIVVYVGLALYVSGQHRLLGVLLLIVGLWSIVSAPLVHDRLHREKGEDTHALWGKNDRRKPPWWGAK
jgi:hypothetical protein